MLPYSRGLILDKTNNYGIVKTETVFGFGSPTPGNFMDESFNSTGPLEWVITQGDFAPRSLQVRNKTQLLDHSKEKQLPLFHWSNSSVSEINDKEAPRVLKNQAKSATAGKKTKGSKNKRKGKGKIKKCIFKVIKKNSKKNRRGGNKMPKMQKKYMMPLILGLLAAKSILIPIALKALAFLSAKGLMMGFFSTVMASVLSLKGMFDHSHSYQNRKDDTKTQVEIIQVPTKTEDHVYYDEHYKRGDVVPILINEHGTII